MSTIKLPEYITLKDININNNSETNGFNILNLNTKEINRIINLLLKRVIELSEEQDINNIIHAIFDALENTKKRFKLSFDLQVSGLPTQVEIHNQLFEIRREDDLTFSINRQELNVDSEWETNSIIAQVKTLDGVIANASIMTRTPQIIVQFASIPDEDHWLYIL